jgi:hypothetical protein
MQCTKGMRPVSNKLLLIGCFVFFYLNSSKSTNDNEPIPDWFKLTSIQYINGSLMLIPLGFVENK